MTEDEADHEPDTGPCDLCGEDNIDICVRFDDDGDTVNRALCDLHAAKLERWWKQEQAKNRRRNNLKDASDDN